MLGTGGADRMGLGPNVVPLHPAAARSGIAATLGGAEAASESLEDRVARLERENADLSARNLALQIQNAELERLVDYDMLTGVLSRRGLTNKMPGSLDRMARAGKKVSMLVIDVDYLKGVNKKSHAAGDAYLKGVAEAIQAATRPYDLVARQGGDEFVVLLEDIDAATAEKVAERIQAGVADLPFRSEIAREEESGFGMVVSPSVSIGVSSLDFTGMPRHQDYQALFLGLFSNADAASRYVKAAGRNGIALHSPELEADLAAARKQG